MSKMTRIASSNMHKLIVCLFLIFIIVLAACNADEENNNNASDSTEVIAAADSTKQSSAKGKSLVPDDFYCLAADRDTVREWLTGNGKVFFIYYWPGGDEPFTLLSYKRNAQFDRNRDTLRKLSQCRLESTPEGSYIFGNLKIEKAEIRRLHNYNPIGQYEYFKFTPVIISSDPKHVVYRIDRYPEPDPALNPNKIYSPSYTNPAPPREPS